MVPHLEHKERRVAVVTAGIDTWTFVKETNRQKSLEVTVQTCGYMHVIGLELTFAGIDAVGPPVTNIFTAKSSAAFEPSTARSATTKSA